MDFTSALDAPVIRRVGGQEIEFPLWTMAMVAACAARLHARRMEATRAICAELKLEPIDRVTVLGQAQLASPTPWDVARHLETLDGAQACLCESLQKAGWTKDQALEIVGRIPLPEQVELARLVGRIVPPPMPEGMEHPTPRSSTTEAGSTS